MDRLVWSPFAAPKTEARAAEDEEAEEEEGEEEEEKKEDLGVMRKSVAGACWLLHMTKKLYGRSMKSIVSLSSISEPPPSSSHTPSAALPFPPPIKPSQVGSARVEKRYSPRLTKRMPVSEDTTRDASEDGAGTAGGARERDDGVPPPEGT